MNEVATHYYGRSGDLAAAIARHFRETGRDPASVTTQDLAVFDEFHIGGRPATLKVAASMRLRGDSRVLDIGSGLGGPARTLAETYGCHVTGIDLTPAFCDAAAVMSDWVRLADRVAFRQGDATDLPFSDDEFDAAMTIHVGMNIPDKENVYAEARRVLKPGARFVVYDILKGDGGEVLLPVPWARSREIDHLAALEEMRSLLTAAGFTILAEDDSTDRSIAFFREQATRTAQSGRAPVAFHPFLGDDFPQMAVNMMRNLNEERIRTFTFVCE